MSGAGNIWSRWQYMEAPCSRYDLYQRLPGLYRGVRISDIVKVPRRDSYMFQSKSSIFPLCLLSSSPVSSLLFIIFSLLSSALWLLLRLMQVTPT